MIPSHLERLHVLLASNRPAITPRTCVFRVLSGAARVCLFRLLGAATRLFLFCLLALTLPTPVSAQSGKTLVAVLAHPDDESIFGPVLARYAREGARVHMLIVTDGSRGNAHTQIAEGPELAAVRAEEAICAANALGVEPPVLLGFPDGELGDYVAEPTLLYRLTPRLQAEIARLRPDAVMTFGPDGATGHPDHRLVGSLVTQLARAGAPGVPERVFYGFIPADGYAAVNPERGAPPFTVPEAKHVSVQVSFSPEDLRAAQEAVACHRTQFPEETLGRMLPAMARGWAGRVPLAPAFQALGGKNDLFR
jgi:LmbE family N-acetylglucosaminyl deacetylase